MNRITPVLAILFFILPYISSAAALTQQQSTSLIAVVQSSPGTPASAFVSLITAFSNITTNQATSLITVVQSAPGVPANAFVNLLTSFTVDTPTIQPITPITTSSDVCTNIEGIQTTIPGGMTATGNVCIATQVNTPTPTSTQSAPQITKDLTLNVITDLPVPFSGFHSARIEAKYTENGKEVGVSKSYSLSNGESKTFQGDLFDITPKSLADITVTVMAGGLTKSINIPVIPYVKVDPSVTSMDKNAVLSLGSSLVPIGEFTIKDGSESPVFLGKIKGTTNAPYGALYRITYLGDSRVQSVQDNGTILLTGLSASSQVSGGFQEKKTISVRIDFDAPSIPGNYSMTITSFEAWDAYGNYKDVQGLPITFRYTVQ